MTEFTQVLSGKDLKRAITIHYFGYKYTYIGPVLGGIILIGLLIVAIILPKGYPDTPFYIYLLGAFMLLRLIYFIQNVYKSYKTSKSSAETNFKIIGDDQIIISNNGNLTSLNMRDLYSYSDTKTFVFLYTSRNQYLFLDKRQMDKSSITEIVNILDILKIKKR